MNWNTRVTVVRPISSKTISGRPTKTQGQPILTDSLAVVWPVSFEMRVMHNREERLVTNRAIVKKRAAVKPGDILTDHKDGNRVFEVLNVLRYLGQTELLLEENK